MKSESIFRGMAMSVLLGLLAGCASDGSALPACDAKHRRPANPHGTVLPGGSTSPVGQLAPAAGPASPPASGTAATPEREVSSVNVLSYVRCGSAA